MVLSICMDKRKIDEILDQLVTWQPRERVDDKAKVKDRNETKKRLLDMGYEEEDIDQILDEMANDSRMVMNGENITVPKKIKSIKHQPKLCDLGCGDIVVNQVIEKTFHFWPTSHWRTKCTNCQHYVHPQDGRLVKGVHAFQAYYMTKSKKKNK